MKYYKIMQDNEFIGAVCSNDFVRYQQKHQCYIGTNEEYGEFVSYNGILYHSTWMKPIKTQDILYEEASLIAITEEQYNIFMEAIQTNTEISELEPIVEIDEEPLPEQLSPADENTLEFVRTAKINQMSLACNRTITNGFDLALRGETKHFSLTAQDQINLMSLSLMAQTQSLIPYHADGEETTFYTNDEINTIVQTATELKIYNTTYYNSLKGYINSLETIEEISAITYGVSIPEEYKSEALKVLE